MSLSSTPATASWRSPVSERRELLMPVRRLWHLAAYAIIGSRLAGIGAELTAAPPAKPLVTFEPGGAGRQVRPTDARIEWTPTAEGGHALRVTTGCQESWPGVTWAAPGAPWDLSAFAEINVALKNPGTNHVTVYARVDNPGADGVKHCLTRSVALGPGAAGRLLVELKRTSDSTLGGKLFGMRGYPVAPGGEGAINPSNVTQLLLFVSQPTAPHQFEVSRIEAAGAYVAPTAWVTDANPYFPFIDTLGQYRHKDWPGKAASTGDLERRRQQEAELLARDPGPSSWNPYGGWKAGPQLPATGFFRVEKQRGKWWLIDPAGHLFFSHGIDCVRMHDVTPIEERESWFETFPGSDPAFAEFVVPAACALKGHYAGRSPKSFSFAGANLSRKYGPDWRKTYPDVVHRRLRSWGLNTIGNWSDEGVRLLRRTPYTDSVGSHGAKMIEASEGYWGKFPDVFDPTFRQALVRAMAAKTGKSAGDPWCIGYFSDNEMAWGDEISLAVAALASPPGQAAKLAFLDDLKTKYREVSALNAVWGTDHASWEALAESQQAPDRRRAEPDLFAFYTRAAEAYFRTVRDTIKAVAPQQLYLGCRFAWVNARAARAAAKYCDVVSYNLYQRSVADFHFNGDADVPLIIGEFHFGALDRGLFHTGLVPVANQAARAEAYRDYVLGAARHPQFVGCHWFQYQDEPTTGRVYDEENYQIGFVDIADTPYLETVQAARAVADRLYPERWGE